MVNLEPVWPGSGAQMAGQMTAEIITKDDGSALPVWLVEKGGLDRLKLDPAIVEWAELHGFDGASGALLTLPGGSGGLAGALFGIGAGDDSLVFGKLATGLPNGVWKFAGEPENPTLAALGFLLGGYRFETYKTGEKPREVKLVIPPEVDAAQVRLTCDSAKLARDLINVPANDMGPAAIEKAAKAVAAQFKARTKVTAGAQLLKKNFPMIHAVGRAASEAPRLVDFTWGPRNAPKVTLVGKGVAFDTGGLDIKPSSSMLLMKKDMGGAANVLALAMMVMGSRLQMRLRVLIPAVENSISATAFRPGDILKSRNGLTVEIGNTDAEGRLILADALALADEESPDILIDMATLTGAARVALGPDLPPFYTDDDTFAAELAAASAAVEDPLWRMPLWRPYERKLASKIADTNNVTADGFAGSITAALFLKKFVSKTKIWAHFDIFGWNLVEKAHAPAGGEAQAIRAIFEVLRQRYPAKGQA
jgi:leucyl aminopeptidase